MGSGEWGDEGDEGDEGDGEVGKKQFFFPPISPSPYPPILFSCPMPYFAGLRASNISNSLVDLSGLVAVIPKPRMELRMVLV